MTEQQIILSLQAGGIKTEKAILAIYNKSWWRKLYKYIQTQVRSKEDAEEIAMDTIALGARKVLKGKFEGRSSLYTYFAGIARYEILTHRDKRKRTVSFVDEETISESGYTPTDDLQTQEIRSIAHRVLDKIGKQCKDILLLSQQKFKNKEIAQKVGYANGQVVANQKNKCWNKLLTLLDGNHDLKNVLKGLIK